jgi:drug/metabolite transporter (DMT)-like permease
LQRSSEIRHYFGRFVDQHRLLAGALFIVAAELMFACMGATIRHLSAELNNGMLVFARNLVGLAFVAVMATAPGWRELRTSVPHLHLLRGTAGLGAMYCFFYAIAHMPLANAMLLKLTAPLFMPLVALFWLGERFTWHVVLALGVGFAGVTLILLPDFAEMAPVAMIALSGGALAAIAKVTVRRLSATEPPTRTVFYFAAIGTLASLFPLAWLWQMPSEQALLWLLALGAFATAGQLMLTRGMGCAPAARLGPFTFFSVVFGAVLGWVFFEEMLGWPIIVGTLLVLASALLVGRGIAPARPRSAAEVPGGL